MKGRALVAVVVIGTLALAAELVSRLPPVLWALVQYSAPPVDVTLPVAGVRAEELSDTWGAARSEGRHHEGIDIFAPRGTAVVAATAGKVVRVGQNRLGGNVIYIAGDGAQLYYYAHLDSFRAGLEPGDTVAAGDVIGHVGKTGNAAHTPPHLHFGIYPASNWFRAVDPYPFLRDRARTVGTPLKPIKPVKPRFNRGRV
ncbi:MAG TPA: M23 family metallopeptidase [Polyangia bacterium]|nr:M23 family metallopeptidase [Polyangia bacterium]